MKKFRKKKEKNNKGFTLVELLVTMIIMTLVLGLTVQVTQSFYHRYRMIEARWIAQNAAQKVMNYFELHSESLSNSAMISLFYTDATQPVNISPNPPQDASGNALSKMIGVPKESNNSYAYIYTQTDPLQPELGDLIYVLERGNVKQPVSLTYYLTKEHVPLDIHFEIAPNPEGVENHGTQTEPDFVYEGGHDEYLRSTVDVIISTPRSIGGNYQLKTSFTMNNMAGNQRINFEGPDGSLTETGDNIFVAGWADAKLNAEKKYPFTEEELTATKYSKVLQPANILRYVSTQSFLESQNLTNKGVDIEGAGLCFGKLTMKGSAIESQVLNSLRDFRDNVLSKSALGNKIIDAYYTSWSPALVEMAQENPNLLKVGKCVLVPTSLFAMLLAD